MDRKPFQLSLVAAFRYVSLMPELLSTNNQWLVPWRQHTTLRLRYLLRCTNFPVPLSLNFMRPVFCFPVSLRPGLMGGISL